MKIRCSVILAICFTLAADSATAASEKIDNECAKSLYERITNMPYTGVCENEWSEEKGYVCKDFARDECREIRARGGRAWKLGMKLLMKSDFVGGVMDAFSALNWAAKQCNINRLSFFSRFCPIPGRDKDVAKKISPKELSCLSRFLSGHVVNIVDISDATAKRLGLYNFAVHEPQDRDPNRTIVCTWQQATPYPQLPDSCKKKVWDRYYSTKGPASEMPLVFKIAECDEPFLGDPGYVSKEEKEWQ